MAYRTSIELHSDGCRLVEVEVPRTRQRVAECDVHVRSFAALARVEDEGAEPLAALRQQRKLARAATVVIWGLRTTQQVLRLPPAKSADLELLAAREARKELATFDADGGATIALALGDEVQVGANRRREVVVVGAGIGEVQRRIEPLTAAGFVVERVVTPALALADLARTSSDTTASTVSAYVAVGRDATCIAIVRGGLLLFSREMPWGHRDPGGAADGVATRLTSELRRSVLYFKQTFRAPVESVVLCGDMPNLRSLTAPLTDALSLPVKTLDSLVGVDALRLPEPADDFRARVAALRLALASAVAPSAANLLPQAVRRARESRAQGLRLGAAVAAGVLLTAAPYGVVQHGASSRRQEIRSLQQELSSVEPQASRADALRHEHDVAAAQRAALGAFDSQAPRVARILEAISRNTPQDVVLTAINLHAQGVTWRLSVGGAAISQDAAAGQAALNALLGGLAKSPYVGSPAEPPSVRMVTGAVTPNPETAKTAPAIPPGMSGVEFTLQFDVAR